MKLARRSFEAPWECTKDWPDDCFVQCGARGMVFTGNDNSLERALTTAEGAIDALTGKSEHYVTAFFEAFPRDPDTFIRGEGTTIEEAEQKAWDKFQRHLACENHEFERRGYTNGAGFCKNCGLFKSAAFEPTTECYLCGAKTYYGNTNDSRYYCEVCKDQVPDELLPDFIRRARAERAARAAAGLSVEDDLDL